MAASVVLNKAKSGTRVSEATRERIVEAASALGYRRNAVAHSLKTRRTDVIGFYSGNNALRDRSPYLSEVVFGAQQACDVAGKDLLLYGVLGEGHGEHVIDTLLDGRIDGVVVHASPGDEVCRRLIDLGFPVVAHTDAVDGVPSVVVDDWTGGRLQAEHLYEKGHQKVMYKSRILPYESIRRRENAFRERALELGMEVADGDRTSTMADHRLTDRDQERIADGITAIAVWDDGCAQRVCEDLEQAGRKVPDDVSVIGYNGVPPIYPLKRELTTIQAPFGEVAATAVRLLLERIAGQSIELETVLPVSLRAGGTT